MILSPPQEKGHKKDLPFGCSALDKDSPRPMRTFFDWYVKFSSDTVDRGMVHSESGGDHGVDCSPKV
jgi:hypothetical protein